MSMCTVWVRQTPRWQLTHAQVVDTSELWVRKLNDLVDRKVIPRPGAFKAGSK